MKKNLVLGVIPARGGSKGIPNKNIVPILGKPLLNYTIEAALGSRHLTHCIVSTDSADIAVTATKAGALVPFLRPSELATDTALSLPVILHSLEFMERTQGINYDVVVMLQPTTPLRSSSNIDVALEKLFETGADSVISVVEVGASHPLRMKRVIGGRLVNYIDQGFEDMRPRQHLPPVYIRNGAIYAARRHTILEQQTFAGPNCMAYIMPPERSVNIDTPADLKIAEYYLENLIAKD